MHVYKIQSNMEKGKIWLKFFGGEDGKQIPCIYVAKRTF
jgi:hypothetical protein